MHCRLKVWTEKAAFRSELLRVLKQWPYAEEGDKKNTNSERMVTL